MESDKSINAFVPTPAKDAHIRTAKGFSLSEIKESGHSIEDLKNMNLKIDYFRKSKHDSNIAELKNLKIEKKSGKKREPFKLKEKKTTAYKPKKEKPAVKPKLVEKEEKPKVKVKPIPVKKEKEKPVKKSIPKAKPAKEETTPLTKLSGLGPATVSKFEQLGVSCAEDLVKEDAKELASLIKGVSEERIIKWKQECEELLK